MLLRVEVQMARLIAIQQSTRGHHFCVQQGLARQQPVKETAMFVGPIHHGRDTQGMRFKEGWVAWVEAHLLGEKRFDSQRQ
jgi:hypothetical protein